MSLEKDTLPEQPNNDSLGNEKVTESNEKENMREVSETVVKMVEDVFRSAEKFPTSKDENIVELALEDYNALINTLFEYKNVIDKQGQIIEKLKSSFDTLNKKIDDLGKEVKQREQEDKENVISSTINSIELGPTKTIDVLDQEVITVDTKY